MAAYTYDTQGRMATVSAAALSATAFAYTYLGASDQVASLAMPGGVGTAKTYDALGRLATVTNSGPGAAPGSTISSFSYTVDSHDRRTRVDLADGGRWEYTYDTAGQLTGGVRYARRLQDSAEQVLATYGYQYDPMGNPTRRSEDAGVSDYTYNSLNQLVTGAWSGTLSAFGWTRTAGLSGIAVTAGQQQQAAAVFETGAWTAKGLVLPAGGIGGILAVTSSSSALQNPGSALYAYDGNGNAVALVDAATAAPLAAYEYGPFGNTLVAAGPLADINPIRFSSKYAETARMPGMPAGPDLYYYGHRYYSPGIGRWMSRDPIGENGGMNRFVFAGGAPCSRVDILGLFAPGWPGDPGLTLPPPPPWLPWPPPAPWPQPHGLFPPTPPAPEARTPCCPYLSEVFTWVGNIPEEAQKIEQEEFPGVIDPFEGDYRHCVGACLLVRSLGPATAVCVILLRQESETDPRDSEADWRGYWGAIHHPLTTCREMCKTQTVRPLTPLPSP